ncbi:hypothetical protein V8G54_000152 (mitochondrion) [Vigna mungo]|uniref:Uncharacterized protein n=1 Tax=Vigna mungo TaxID=3915 RepID=A0AAQ3SH20_VIGMU
MCCLVASQMRQGEANSVRVVKENNRDWLRHSNAHENFSSQEKFLSSNFLFSVPPKKPRHQEPDPGTAGSVLACSLMRQFSQAWDALSSLQNSSRNYVQPGKNVNVNWQSHENTRTAPIHGGYQNDNRMCPDVTDIPVVSRNTSWGLDGSLNNHNKCTGQINESSNCMSGDIDDDNILEIHVDADFSLFVSVLLLVAFKNIDVDQIVEEYQSTCTPKPSISKLPPITPNADKDEFARQGGDVLPPDLCLDCIHGYKALALEEDDVHKRKMKHYLTRKA